MEYYACNNFQFHSATREFGCKSETEVSEDHIKARSMSFALTASILIQFAENKEVRTSCLAHLRDVNDCPNNAKISWSLVKTLERNYTKSHRTLDFRTSLKITFDRK